jgi:predicted TIM-barrel fold metal-dependent hydrolase
MNDFRAIDCDIHPSIPGIAALLPYFSDHWRATILDSGLGDLESASYPLGSPLTARADWRPARGKAAASLDAIRAEALDPFDTSIAICNCLYGVQVIFNEDMAAAFSRAVNTWMARERLDAEPRLRASIVVPMQNPETAAEEIDHWAHDRRFVQVLMLVSGELPLGRRSFWPIYRAAEKHGLPVAIHAGSAYRHPVTAVGWPSFHAEDYVNQAQAFQTTLTSLICEGVFDRFPRLTVVLTESGFAWLPSLVWRLTKFWKGLRHETPWVDRPPYEIVREQVRLTLQPVDAPPEPRQLERLMEHMGSDRLLLYSTDYPHWQFDGTRVLPDGLSPPLIRRMMVDNPLDTYPRLREAAP